MSKFSFEQRQHSLERASEEVVDLLVIGGGITGAGVAREAALRGLKTVLVDKGDFASGTSSRSSKLVHGGLRYLAQGDVALVREAARERSVLRRIAPHLVRPLTMLMPVASRGGRMKLTAGLWTFDKLAGDSGDSGHHTFDRRELYSAAPALRPDTFTGGVSFTEYATNDARLTLETILSAAGHGASVVNYAEVTGVVTDPAGLRVSVVDRVGDDALEIRARSVVNAAGPWFDSIRGLVDRGAAPSMQLTRGIHLVVPRSCINVDQVVVLKSPDGRSTFVVPRGDYAYIGTTDTHYQGQAEEPGASRDDAQYLLDSAAATFAESPTLDDVVGMWSGVRPLLRQEGKSPSEISRRDEIMTGPGPVVSIAGGKLTTYRRMGERVVDRVFEVLGCDERRSGFSHELPLAGGDAAEQERTRAASAGIDDKQLSTRLWQKFGTAAAEIEAEIRDDSSAGEPLGALAELTRAEVGHAVHYEMALTLDDVLRRRSDVAMFRTRDAIAAAGTVAKVMAPLLGWDTARETREVRDFVDARRKDLESAGIAPA